MAVAGKRCEACRAELGRFATDPICPTCQTSTSRQVPSRPARRLAPAVWMWSLPEASAALSSRDLASILRTYRRLNRLSQERLAIVLWPLVARLEARAAEGYAERDVLVLLAQGRAALGVSLGTVLPAERLAAAARWTDSALAVAERLDDPAFLGHALRMHGNELRKADRPAAAVARLARAVEFSSDCEGRGTAYALLARAAGETGDQALFDEAINGFRELLDNGDGHGMLFNPFTFREIQLRGSISTGRAAAAVRVMQVGQADVLPVAPQWYVIERVTAARR